MEMNLSNDGRGLVVLFVVVVAVALSNLVRGEEVRGEEVNVTVFPSLAKIAMQIDNYANRTITFALRPDDGEWKTYSITSGNKDRFTCEECTTFEFIMRSDGGKEVEYVLHVRKRYFIGWSDADQRWDLFERTSP